MKTFLSKLRSIGLLAFAIAAFAPVLPAADLTRTYVASYTPATLTSLPAALAAITTNTSTYQVLDTRRHDNIAVLLSGALMLTNPAAATLTIPLYRSVDGTTFEDTAFTSLILTFTGTVPKAWSTNINVGAFGYIRFGGGSGIANTATNTATNLLVSVVGKPPWALTYPSAGP